MGGCHPCHCWPACPWPCSLARSLAASSRHGGGSASPPSRVMGGEPCSLLLLDFLGGVGGVNPPTSVTRTPSPPAAPWPGCVGGMQQEGAGAWGWGGGCQEGGSGQISIPPPGDLQTGELQLPLRAGKKESPGNRLFPNPVWCSPSPPGPWHWGVPPYPASSWGPSRAGAPPHRPPRGSVPTQASHRAMDALAGGMGCLGGTHRAPSPPSCPPQGGDPFPARLITQMAAGRREAASVP